MKKDFKMTQEEMDKLISINREGGNHVMNLSGGIPMGKSRAEQINDYWVVLGAKYGFKPMTAGPSKSNDPLTFNAEPI